VRTQHKNLSPLRKQGIFEFQKSLRMQRIFGFQESLREQGIFKPWDTITQPNYSVTNERTI